MPRGRGKPPRAVPPGTTFASWVIVREVERVGTNRRFECRCFGCGTVSTKWLANLVQAKTGCTTCRPPSTYLRPALAAIIAERAARAQVSDRGRICLSCGEWKPWDRIAPDKRRTNGKGSNCLDCGHWRSIRASYGITRAEWEWLLASQNGKCALCGGTDTKRLSVDHDHTCHPGGRACKQCIRGMLCDICNRLIGLAETRPLVRARFADYLGCRPFVPTACETDAVVEFVDRPASAAV